MTVAILHVIGTTWIFVFDGFDFSGPSGQCPGEAMKGVCSYMCLGFLFALFWFLRQGLTLLGENSLHSTSWP